MPKLSSCFLLIAFYYGVLQLKHLFMYCTLMSMTASKLKTEFMLAFCSAGIVFYYGLFQLIVWWFCHEVSLFWTIRFPIHAKRFETSRRVKYFHITMVVVGLVLPTLPVIVTFTTGDPSGFGMTRFPPILCTGLQKDSTFYSLVLPINILMIIGIPLLIIIFWTIHKVMAVYTHNGA